MRLDRLLDSHSANEAENPQKVLHFATCLRSPRYSSRESFASSSGLTLLDASAISTRAQTRAPEPRVPDAAITEVDPVVGTWELDIAASMFTPGPPPKSEIRLYELEHEGIKATVVTTYADGRRTIFEYIRVTTTSLQRSPAQTRAMLFG